MQRGQLSSFPAAEGLGQSSLEKNTNETARQTEDGVERSAGYDLIPMLSGGSDGMYDPTNINIYP